MEKKCSGRPLAFHMMPAINLQILPTNAVASESGDTFAHVETANQLAGSALRHHQPQPRHWSNGERRVAALHRVDDAHANNDAASATQARKIPAAAPCAPVLPLSRKK